MDDGHLDAETARELFRYEPDSGRLFRRHRGRERLIESPAGPYLKVTYRGRRYEAHRVIWLVAHGRWPDGCIDHINGDGRDNRLANLRDVSAAVNAQNVRNARGWWRTKVGTFAAVIRHQGRTLHLGCFRTPEDAHAAYVAAKRNLHAGCTI